MNHPIKGESHMHPRPFADQHDRTPRRQRTRLAPEERLRRGWHEQEDRRELVQLSDTPTPASPENDTKPDP
jgi:hypothetical protein